MPDGYKCTRLFISDTLPYWILRIIILFLLFKTIKCRIVTTVQNKTRFKIYLSEVSLMLPYLIAATLMQLCHMERLPTPGWDKMVCKGPCSLQLGICIIPLVSCHRSHQEARRVSALCTNYIAPVMIQMSVYYDTCHKYMCIHEWMCVCWGGRQDIFIL